MQTYHGPNGRAIHTDTDSWGPLALLYSADGLGLDLERFATRAELDAKVIEITTNWADKL